VSPWEKNVCLGFKVTMILPSPAFARKLAESNGRFSLFVKTFPLFGGSAQPSFLPNADKRVPHSSERDSLGNLLSDHPKARSNSVYHRADGKPLSGQFCSATCGALVVRFDGRDCVGHGVATIVMPARWNACADPSRQCVELDRRIRQDRRRTAAIWRGACVNAILQEFRR
jgi:hypothetical protein